MKIIGCASVYDCPDLAAIDTHLARLTHLWRAAEADDPAAACQVLSSYIHDRDALLDARTEMARHPEPVT